MNSHVKTNLRLTSKRLTFVKAIEEAVGNKQQSFEGTNISVEPIETFTGGSVCLYFDDPSPCETRGNDEFYNRYKLELIEDDNGVILFETDCEEQDYLNQSPADRRLLAEIICIASIFKKCSVIEAEFELRRANLEKRLHDLLTVEEEF